IRPRRAAINARGHCAAVGRVGVARKHLPADIDTVRVRGIIRQPAKFYAGRLRVHAVALCAAAVVDENGVPGGAVIVAAVQGGPTYPPIAVDGEVKTTGRSPLPTHEAP